MKNTTTKYNCISFLTVPLVPTGIEVFATQGAVYLSWNRPFAIAPQKLKYHVERYEKAKRLAFLLKKLYKALIDFKIF